MTDQDSCAHERNKQRTRELNERREKIRKLNDVLRQQLAGGFVVITRGIQDLGVETVARVMNMMRAYDSFTEDDDPYQEHDFGAFECDGKKLFWKIDYYDKQLEYGSPDAADPYVTTRVLTIMLASEY